MSCANAAVESAKDAPIVSPISFDNFMRNPRGRSLREAPRQGVEDRPLSDESGLKSSAIFKPARHFAAILAPPASFQIGRTDLGPLQQFGPGSFERNQSVDHNVAAVCQAQRVIGILFHDQNGETVLSVEGTDCV